MKEVHVFKDNGHGHIELSTLNFHVPCVRIQNK